MGKLDGQIDIKQFSFVGFVVTLGIVFGDLGTSPLYVMKAIVAGGKEFNSLLIYGSMSCIFWTLTLQTTVKYVMITLKANNNGEGGIFALFALMRKKPLWSAILTMIGASALLADGIITPAITVTSAIEGLQIFNPAIPVIGIVLIIFAGLFFFQQYGTNIMGSSFGPMMAIWFLMLALFGSIQLIRNPEILAALNPVYAVKFLSEYPGGFILLGAVFLCTTGAEALYSDLGHCGLKNIRMSWYFVKTSLLLNYFGQCAWIIEKGGLQDGLNPFFGIMPDWFLVPGILIATAAAVIASQALITGSYTLLSEAITLNFWPKQKVMNPTFLRGQVYVPFVNWFLWIACSFVVIFFKESSNMEAAYGLSITITMIMTTILLSYYLFQKKVHIAYIIILLSTYITIEVSFLVANLHKFIYGGWFTLLLASLFFMIMYGWYFGRKLKNKYVSFVKLDRYIERFKDLVKDNSVPITATNLVYVVKANHIDQVESKVIYSIFQKQPKRANTYWLLHIDIRNEPYAFEYRVTPIIPRVLIRVDFYLGFKVEPQINLYFKEVIEDLKQSGEINTESSFETIRKYSMPADFLFILIDRIMPRDYKFTRRQSLILALHEFSRMFCISDVKALNLDSPNTIEEKVPIILKETEKSRIKRIQAPVSINKLLPK